VSLSRVFLSHCIRDGRHAAVGADILPLLALTLARLSTDRRTAGLSPWRIGRRWVESA